MKKKVENCKQKIKTIFTKDKRIFAKGLCFKKMFLLFVIASIFGVYYEQILNLVTTYLANGSLVWEYRRGVIYGPLSPIYGAGAVLLVLFLARTKRKWWQTVFYGGLIGGSFEYIICFLQETFIGTISWDYTNHFLNINGRTTIPFMVVWGIVAWLFVDFVYPKISKLIERVPYRLGVWVSNFLIVFITLDMLISWTALARQTLRRNEIEPFTIVGEIYDKIYPDEVLIKYFPNMQIKEIK